MDHDHGAEEDDGGDDHVVPMMPHVLPYMCGRDDEESRHAQSNQHVLQTRARRINKLMEVQTHMRTFINKLALARNVNKTMIYIAHVRTHPNNTVAVVIKVRRRRRLPSAIRGLR